MTLYDKVAMLRGKPGAWGTRIGCELQYAASLSTAKDHKYDAVVEAAADALIAASNASIFATGMPGISTLRRVVNVSLPLP